MITYSDKKYSDLLHLKYLESLSILGLGDKVDEVTYLLKNIDIYEACNADVYMTDVNEIANKKNPECEYFLDDYTTEDGTISVYVNPVGGGYYYMEFCIMKGRGGTSATHESFVTKEEVELLTKIFKLIKVKRHEPNMDR